MFNELLNANLEQIRTRIAASTKATGELGMQNYELFGEDQPWMKLTDEGKSMCKNESELEGIAALLHKPWLSVWTNHYYMGAAGFVTKENLNHSYDVALKRFALFPIPFGLKLTAFEQLDVMTNLMADDFDCVSPIAAAPKRLLTLWHEGEHPKMGDAQFKKFLKTLKHVIGEYKREGNLNPEFSVDPDPINYFLNPAADKSTPIWKQYKILDPVGFLFDPEKMFTFNRNQS